MTTTQPAGQPEAPSAAGSMGPKVRAACWGAEHRSAFAAIGPIAGTQALARGEAGTRVTVKTAVHTG